VAFKTNADGGEMMTAQRGDPTAARREGGETPAVSLVVPIYNEERIVERSLSRLAATLRLDFAEFEIIAVDDGSADTTPIILRRLARQLPQLRVISHEKNRGIGAALRSGFVAAIKDLVFYTDVDEPIAYSEIVRICTLLLAEDADLVIGRRHGRTGESLNRRLYSVAYNQLVRAVFGTRYEDVNFACKLVRRSALEALALRSSGSFIDAELILKAERSGLRVVQVPMEYRPRRSHSSYLARPRVILGLLVELARSYPELRDMGRGSRQQ